jgi:thioredoxin-dependent peroxiredoxin
MGGAGARIAIESGQPEEVKMRLRAVPIVAAAILAIVPAAVSEAALQPGAAAPQFRTQGALGGKAFTLDLRQQLRKGPVVLYFFPAAFTSGCTAEAYEFAEASDDFKKAGATVIGMSADPIDKLIRFSVEACRNKFAVATASPQIIAGYDVKLPQREGLSNRTSFVIAPNGRVIYTYSDMDYRDHVKNTLAAVRNWRTTQRR